MEHSIIYRKEGRYSCFPQLLRYPDGRLLTRFSTRLYSSHVDHSGGEATLASDDGGRSWYSSDEAMINPAWRSSDGALIRAGAIAWRYAPLEEQREIEARDIEVRPTPSGEAAYAYGVFAEKSYDGGETWVAKPVDYPHRPLTMAFHEHATFLRLSDTTAMRLVYSRTRAKKRYYELNALRTEDNGESWFTVPVASDPREEIGYGESAILRCANGDLLVLMRTECAGGTRETMAMTRSTDGGFTWSSPVETKMHGHPPDLLMLSNGHILCTYGYRTDPMGVRAMFSTDDGRSFAESSLVVLRDDGKRSADGGRGGDLGYPISVELDDGSLFTIYYMTVADGITHIAGTHWKEQV
jgi:sialidase-1